MARSIPIYLSSFLEELELARPELVTLDDIKKLAKKYNVNTSASLIAARLREKGWLIKTTQQGVWEFAPAEVAGAYSGLDPLLPIKAFALANPTTEYALTFQTAAWALGFADRVPVRIEVAFAAQPKVKVSEQISSTTYKSNLATSTVKGVKVLAPEAIIVNLVNRPGSVRSWSSVQEWIPDIAYEIDASAILEELQGRAAATWARAGYLLQGMRPDVADSIRQVFTPTSKVKFGRKDKAKRNDEHWMVSDAALSFDPRDMEPVR